MRYASNDIRSKVRVKRGVKLDKLKPEILLCLEAAYHAYKLEGLTITVTSTNDGKHMKGSKHYINQAFDSRIWYFKNGLFRYLTKQQLNRIKTRCEAWLGKDYDIVIEKDHLHFEWDRK